MYVYDRYYLDFPEYLLLVLPGYQAEHMVFPVTTRFQQSGHDQITGHYKSAQK